MSPTRKDRIRDAFAGAILDYEDNAAVQRVAAVTVADLAMQRRTSARPRILEIGCGTGLLTREIALRWPDAERVVTDLAPAMVETAGAAMHAAGTFLPMDGEFPCFEGQWFDLILSSLAFQWFADLPRALDRLHALLRPGGSLIFSTMAERSFREWRAAHEACGLAAGTPDYPSLEALGALARRFGDGFAFDEEYPQGWGSGRAFLAHLKAIGASVPRADRAPLSTGDLRRVMRAFETGGAVATYHVGFVRISRAR